LRPRVIVEDAHSSGTVLAFSPSGDILASGGADGRLRLWRSTDGTELAGWQACADTAIKGIAFLSDRRLLTGGFDGNLALWTLEGRLLVRRQSGSPIEALDVRGDRAITGHLNGRVGLWDLADLTETAGYPLHKSAVRAVALGPDGWAASAGRDGEVFAWRRSEPPRRLPRPSYDAYDLAFAPDGRWLMGSAFFRLLRWSLDKPGLQEIRTEHHGIIKAIDFTPDGQQLASISRQTDSAVYLLDATSGVVTRRFQGHELCGEDVRVSRDGRYLATTSDDASVRIWNLGRDLPAAVQP
jgi:WD40 repeat protein